MANPNNVVILSGNLVRDMKIIEDTDGSHAVFLTIAVKNNFKTKNREDKLEYGAEFINVQSKYWNTDSGNAKFKFVKERALKGRNVSIIGHIEEHNISKDPKEPKYIRNTVYDSLTFGAKSKINNDPKPKEAETVDPKDYL